jgi:hypothetical protein
VEKMVECLGLAWEITTLREHANANRENTKLLKKNRLLDYFIQLTPEDMVGYNKNVQKLRITLRDRAFREYQIGDRFFRKRHPVRAFKSAGEKEAWKISLKLQPRYDGPYVIAEKLSAVLYVANIDGEMLKVHAVNMKPEIATREEHLEDFMTSRKDRKWKNYRDQKLKLTSTGGTTGQKSSLSPENYDTKDSEAEIIEGTKTYKSNVILYWKKVESKYVDGLGVNIPNSIRVQRDRAVSLRLDEEYESFVRENKKKYEAQMEKKKKDFELIEQWRVILDCARIEDEKSEEYLRELQILVSLGESDEDRVLESKIWRERQTRIRLLASPRVPYVLIDWEPDNSIVEQGYMFPDKSMGDQESKY